MPSSYQRSFCAAACLTAILGFFSAGAAFSASASKPYDSVPVTYDRPAEPDAALKTLIERLRLGVAERNLRAIEAELGAGLAIVECTSDPTRPCPAPEKAASPDTAAGSRKASGKAPLPAKPATRPLELLLQGLCCKDVPRQHITKAMREDNALGIIGAALEEEMPGANPDFPGSMCLPAFPAFDRSKAAKMITAADIDPDHLRVASQTLLLRARPAKDAPDAGQIAAGEMVPLITETEDSLPDGWSSIALPQGGVAFTQQGGLNDLSPAGLCFTRNDGGNWKIALVVQRKS